MKIRSTLPAVLAISGIMVGVAAAASYPEKSIF